MKNVKSGKIFVRILIVLTLFILLIVYGVHNPESSSHFPKCPFRLITGYLCPGCGSQRAIHYLLNLELNKALSANALLVYSIPVIILLFLIERFNGKYELTQRLHAVFFHGIFILSYLGVILIWWICRNIS